MDKLLKGKLSKNEVTQNTDAPKSEVSVKKLTSAQKKEQAIIALAASIGAVLGILAYNFGWLG